MNWGRVHWIASIWSPGYATWRHSHIQFGLKANVGTMEWHPMSSCNRKQLVRTTSLGVRLITTTCYRLSAIFGLSVDWTRWHCTSTFVHQKCFIQSLEGESITKDQTFYRPHTESGTFVWFLLSTQFDTCVRDVWHAGLCKEFAQV